MRSLHVALGLVAVIAAGLASPQAHAQAQTVRPAHCPAVAGNCSAATGRVIYIEAVDPDGDGDAHYVLVGGGVTAPGLSVIDVEKSMRPRRLPGLGDTVSAAGPVYPGSYGQHQIQATVIHYGRGGR